LIIFLALIIAINIYNKSLYYKMIIMSVLVHSDQKCFLNFWFFFFVKYF